MISIILKFIILLPLLVPSVIFAIGAYIFFSEGKYFESVVFVFMTVMFLAMAPLKKFPLGIKEIHSLKTQGQKIMTEFKALDRRWNTSVNGQSPIVVYSQANGRIFESEDLWLDGGSASPHDPLFKAWQILQSRDLAKKYLIPVYVNPAKPKEYYMDLGALEVE